VIVKNNETYKLAEIQASEGENERNKPKASYESRPVKTDPRSETRIE